MGLLHGAQNDGTRYDVDRLRPVLGARGLRDATGAIEKDDALSILNYAKVDVEEHLKEERELRA